LLPQTRKWTHDALFPERAAEGMQDREKVRIENIVSNPKLDESQFAMSR